MQTIRKIMKTIQIRYEVYLKSNLFFFCFFGIPYNRSLKLKIKYKMKFKKLVLSISSKLHMKIKYVFGFLIVFLYFIHRYDD